MMNQSAQDSGLNQVALSFNHPDRSDPLSVCVRHAVRYYLHHIGDHPAGDLYALFMREIERPLIEEVLEFTLGNQSKASMLLGLSRTTLRKKLALYHLDLEVEGGEDR